MIFVGSPIGKGQRDASVCRFDSYPTSGYNAEQSTIGKDNDASLGENDEHY